VQEGKKHVRRAGRFAPFIALGALAVIVPSAAVGFSAPAASTAARYTIKIEGIDRAGHKVAVEPAVFGASNGADYLTYLSSVTVPRGTYVVAAAVPEPGQNSATLVAKTVRVRSNVTVKLSAVGAARVAATMSGLPMGVGQANQQAMLCLRKGGGFTQVTGLLVVPTLVNGNATAGTVYVQHMAGSGLRFVYQTYWQGLGPIYDQAAAYNGGLPAHPVYAQKVAGLARVNVQLRAGEDSTPLRNVESNFDGCGSLALPEESLPATYSDYRTPGSWQTMLNFGPTETDITRRLSQAGTYLAGHVYSQVLGGAVAGPEANFPVISGTDVTFAAREMFADPVGVLTMDCEGSGRAVLDRGTRVVRSAKLTLCGKRARFSAAGRGSGWYTLTVSLARKPARGIKTLLSSAVSLSWHFRYAPVAGHRVDKQAAPVTVTEFRPAGLGSSDNAAGGTTTTIRVVVLRGGGQAVSTPKYRLTVVRVQASYNNGKSWHDVRLRRSGTTLLALVANPAGGGYVSLRSVVADSRGDKTIETITRAYLVNAAR
jgi:hypothetical protein